MKKSVPFCAESLLRSFLFLFLFVVVVPTLSARDGLSRSEADAARQRVVDEWCNERRQALKSAREETAVRNGDLVMKYHATVYGEKPADGRSLWISLHGGGSAPQELNDGQWENQKRLYRPAEGVYVAPRAPWNDWDMWFKAPIDALYEQLIQLMVVYEDVNPDKVYILGYSAGGDGVWRMAPRLADHWAAASMMAGHPGSIRMENLLNCPYMIWMGANDAAYDRNRHAVLRSAEIDSLQATCPEGYIHESHIVEGKGHWMDRQDTLAVPWMARYERNPLPRKIIWRQEEVVKSDFYWLSAKDGKWGDRVDVRVDGNTIFIERCDYPELTLWLCDELLSLDKRVKVVYQGRTVYHGKVKRTEEDLRSSIAHRGDPRYCFPAHLTVRLGQ